MPGFRTAVTAGQDMDVLVRGSVTTQDLAYASRALAGLLRPAPATDHVRVKLAEYRGGDHKSLAVAQVNLELHGRLVRAQGTAHALPEAVDRAAAALSPRIHRLHRRVFLTEAGPPSFADEQWDRRESRVMAQASRTGGRSRQVTRHKTYPLAVQGLGAAAFTMDLRDYDFHLFIDEASGQDAVVQRAGAAGYKIAVDRPELLGPGSSDVPVPDPASALPKLTLPEAMRALDVSPAGSLPFTGVGSDRATVLYRRFDGSLGLITSLW